MFWLNFGRWDRQGTAMFTITRVYWNGWKWTPLIYIKPRYKV